MPPVEGHGEWKLCRLASAPVNDARHQDVQGDEEQDQVRDGETDPPFDECPCPDKLGGHAGEGSAALDQVDSHQPHEDQADDGVISDPDVEQLQRTERGRGRAQQAEMDSPAGSGTPGSPAIGRLLGRYPRLRLNHRTAPHLRVHSPVEIP